MNIVDDYSSFIWSIPLQDKSCAFPALSAWQCLHEAETSLSVGTFHTDQGELHSNWMEAWLSLCGTKHEFTAPYTSVQNGQAEHAHLTIQNLVHMMQIDCGMPESHWDEFVKTATYLIVCCPVSTLHDHTPFEAFYGCAPDLSHLHEIGVCAFVLHHVPVNGKMSAHSFECILVSYSANSKAYCCYHQPTHCILKSFHVHFIESEDSVPSTLFPGVVVDLLPVCPVTPPPPLSLPRCSAHLCGVDPNPVTLQLACLDPSARDPLSFAEARHSSNWLLWECALEEEFASIQAMNVYRLIPCNAVPDGCKVLQGKPVFCIKCDEHGVPSQFKACWVLKGYEQVKGLDYTDTHSLTVCSESFCIALHVAAILDWEMRNFDIKTAFLHGELSANKACWMEQPTGFKEPGKEDHVWQLLKALYGMKQAGCVWNITMNNAMQSWGFIRLLCEYCIYYCTMSSSTIIAVMHVDDFLSVASSVEENEHFKAQLHKRWEISEGDVDL